MIFFLSSSVSSVLDLVSLILHKFGNLVGNYLPSLLQIVVFVAGSSSSLLSQRSEIAPRFVSLLKTLRNKSLIILVDVSSVLRFFNIQLSGYLNFYVDTDTTLLLTPIIF